MDGQELLCAVAENLDRRRSEFTNMRRVVLGHVGGILESTVVNMAIPLIYAQWEGYVKEVCQLYLEYIEANVDWVANLQPAMLGHLWTSKLRSLTGGISFSKKKAVAEMALAIGTTKVIFATTEKEVDTKSNLKFEVLEDLCNHLCLDITTLSGWKVRLDSLVNLRNNIAHGSRPTGLLYSDFEERVNDVLGLMEAFEGVLATAVTTRAFCRT